MVKLGIIKTTPAAVNGESLKQVAAAQLRNKINSQATQIQLLEMQLALGKIEDKQWDIDFLVNETMEAYYGLTNSRNETEGGHQIVYNIAWRDSERVLVVTPNGIEAVLPTWTSN